VGRVRDDFGAAGARHHVVSTQEILHGSRTDHGAGPQRIHGDAVALVFFGQAQHAQTHAVLGDAVRQVRSEPARFLGERW
jgi:hypothetical protein